MEDKMSVKKFIKVWSQAGATLVAAAVSFAVMRGWLDWDGNTVAQFTFLYGALMMVLRQMFSVTDTTPPVGTINVSTTETGTKLFSLDVDGDPHDLELLPEVKFKMNPQTLPPDIDVSKLQ